MFGWFAPKCPLATWEKVWTETRMRWLADRFGVRRLLDAVGHERAHELLIGGGLPTADVAAHEWVTDLLPVCLGTGIFLANATVQDSSGSCGGWSWWQVSKQGYLPSRIFGYAFALFAF